MTAAVSFPPIAVRQTYPSNVAARLQAPRRRPWQHEPPVYVASLRQLETRVGADGVQQLLPQSLLVSVLG